MKTLRDLFPFAMLLAAFIWGVVCYYHDATFVAYVPVLLLVFLAFYAK